MLICSLLVVDVPDAVREVERSLAEQYALKRDEHVVRETLRIKATFDRLETPTEQANLSWLLFFQKYFVDERGEPDRTKTASPIVLQGLEDRWALTDHARKIPGLAVIGSGEGHGIRALGWNSREVRAALNEA